jgi:CBS domain-containing protein
MVTAQDLLTNQFVQCDVEDRVSALIAKLKRSKQSAAVVFSKGTYLGVASKDAFLAARENAKEMRVKNLVKKRSKAKTPFFVSKLTPRDGIHALCKKFSASGARILPVLDKKKFLGVVRAADVLLALRDSYRGIEAFILATMDPLMLSEDDTLDTALTMMKRAKIGHAPVVDDRGNLVGMFSAHDYMAKHLISRRKVHARAGASHGKFKNAGFDIGEKVNLGHIEVKGLMSTACCSAPARTKLPVIIDTMITNKVMSVVLTRRNKPVGIITLKDILSDAAKS